MSGQDRSWPPTNADSWTIARRFRTQVEWDQTRQSGRLCRQSGLPRRPGMRRDRLHGVRCCAIAGATACRVSASTASWRKHGQAAALRMAVRTRASRLPRATAPWHRPRTVHRTARRTKAAGPIGQARFGSPRPACRSVRLGPARRGASRASHRAACQEMEDEQQIHLAGRLPRDGSSYHLIQIQSETCREPSFGRPPSFTGVPRRRSWLNLSSGGLTIPEKPLVDSKKRPDLIPRADPKELFQSERKARFGTGPSAY